ncbi:hypothetical protein MP638_001108, partial [Amoeboaphelidium occidentale]
RAPSTFVGQIFHDHVLVVVPKEHFKAGLISALSDKGFGIGGKTMLKGIAELEFGRFERALKEAIEKKKSAAAVWMVQYILQDINATEDMKKVAKEYAKRAAGTEETSSLKEQANASERPPSKKGKGKKNSNKRVSKYLPLNVFRVLFVNIQGAYTQKLKLILSRYSKEFECVILAETWHQEMTAQEYLPWVLAHTPMRQQDLNIANGRAHHGLVVLLNPTLKISVNELKVLQNMIYFRIGTLGILASYLPPSTMTPEQISEELNQVTSRPNLFIGDINCEPLGIRNDTRRDVINTHVTTQWSMAYMDQGPGGQKWDHAYITNDMSATCSVVPDLPIVTDHKNGISVKIDVKGNFTKDPFLVETPLTRFSIRKLSDNSVRTRLINTYNSVMAGDKFSDLAAKSRDIMSLHNLKNVVRNVYHDPEVPDHPDTSQEVQLGSWGHDATIIAPSSDNVTPPLHSVISRCYKFLIEKLHFACKKVIGVHHGSNQHGRATDANSQAERVKDFKRSQRSLGNYRIGSRNEEISVFQDTHLFYSSLFQVSPFYPKRDLTPVPLNNLETLSELHGEVSESFSDKNIENWVKQYSSAKTCGQDGLHIVILKSLIGSKFYLHI